MLQAVIFDMDGTIADTQEFHAKVESELLAEHSMFLTPEEITSRFSGRKTSEWFAEVLPKNVDVKALIDTKWAILCGRVADVKPMPGAIVLIKSMRGKIRLAVASSSRRDYVAAVLSTLGIIDCFESITDGYEVTRGKPSPDIFLLAAKKLKLNPEDCLVIEDALSGMTAAKLAGMKCIGVTTDDRSYPADIIISSLAKLSYHKIKSM